MKNRWLLGLFAWILIVAVLFWRSRRSAPSVPTVVVYVSEDQVFSEPILRDFERETGIQVKAVYDTEEAKSTGAMNRLICHAGDHRSWVLGTIYRAHEPHHGNHAGPDPAFDGRRGRNRWSGMAASDALDRGAAR